MMAKSATEGKVAEMTPALEPPLPPLPPLPLVGEGVEPPDPEEGETLLLPPVVIDELRCAESELNSLEAEEASVVCGEKRRCQPCHKSWGLYYETYA